MLHKRFKCLIMSLVLFVASGCELNVDVIGNGIFPGDSGTSTKIELKSTSSGLMDPTSIGAPVFRFDGPKNMENIKLYSDSSCSSNEIESFSISEDSHHTVRDVSGQNSTSEYYLSYTLNNSIFCVYLSSFQHSSAKNVKLLADSSRTGTYLSVDDDGNSKIHNTSIYMTQELEFIINKTIKHPKKFGFVSPNFYFLTQSNDLYIFSNYSLSPAPAYTNVKEIFFTTPTANSVAILNNNGTVISFGSAGAAPVLANVKTIGVTRYGFVALTNSGSVQAWGSSTNLTSLINGANILDADIVQPSNFGQYQLGVIVKRINGNLLFAGHSLRPGTPSAPRLAQVNGKAEITFYPGLNSLGVTYLDGGVTKGFTWTQKGHGDSLAYDSQLVDIQKLVSNNDAWAALLKNGNIHYWGLFGTSNTLPTPAEMSGVADIIPNDYTISETTNDIQGHAFALMRQDGTVTAMGHNLYGGDVSAVQSDLNFGGIGVKKVIATGRGFAALRNDGRVFVWGNCGNQQKISQLENIQDIVSTTSRTITYCGFAARDKNGDVFIATNSDVVNSQIKFNGINVKNFISASYDRLVYLDKENNIIEITNKFRTVLKSVTRTFSDQYYGAFYMNEAGELYAGKNNAASLAELGATLPNVSQFYSIDNAVSIYKQGSTWHFGFIAGLESLEPSLASFVQTLNLHPIKKIWMDYPLILALDTGGLVHSMYLEPPTLPNISTLDLSVGVKDIYISPSNLTANRLTIFHMTDNTLRYLGPNILTKNFVGTIESLQQIKSVSYNVHISNDDYQIIAKNSSDDLYIFSTNNDPDFSFISSFNQAIAADNSRWIFASSNFQYSFYESNSDTLTPLGALTQVTNDSPKNPDDLIVQYFKVSNGSIIQISRDFAHRLNLNPNNDGFESVYSYDGRSLFGIYPDSTVKQLQIDSIATL